MNKAQISIFIIIASVIVIMFVGFFAFTSDINWYESDTPSYRVTEFIEQCMEQQTQEGIDKLGRQGGWISEEYIPSGLYAGLGDDLIVPAAIGIEDIGGVKRPYWYHFDTNSNEFSMNNIPPYDEGSNSMRAQLENYLDETINTHCLRDFAAFDEAYDITQLEDDFEHTVEFNPGEIVVTLDYPLEIDPLDTQSSDRTQEYMISTYNKLEGPYHLARDMAYAMDGNNFLDHRMFQMLTPYMSKNSRELLPPRYDMTPEFDMDPWLIDDVERLVRHIFSTNVVAIQLEEAYDRGYPFELDEDLQDSQLARGITESMKSYYLGDPTGQEEDFSQVRDEKPEIFDLYSNIDVVGQFQPFHPLYFNIPQSEGNVILLPEAEMFDLEFFQMGLTRYEASYDFTGPVIFSFRDQNQPPNDDFRFEVAYETNVRNNKPLAEGYPRLGGGDTGSVDTTTQTEGDSLVCEPSQFVSDYIWLNITDPVADREDENDPKFGVEDVHIEFECAAGLATCHVGMTDKDENRRTDLGFRLPVNCAPGELRLSKFGHKDAIIEGVNPQEDQEIDLGEVEMPSSREFRMRVDPRDVNDITGQMTMGMRDTEEGFLIFEHQTEDDFIQVVEFDHTNYQNLEIELLPGEYDITGVIINEEEGHKIEEDEFCYEKPGRWGIGSDEDCETIPEVELESWITGQIEYESFEVTSEDLLNPNQQLRTYIVKTSFPRTHSGIERASADLEDSQELYDSLTPEFEEIDW